MQIDLRRWSLESPERTEFRGQPIKCAMNTSVCLSLQGSDISMSLRLAFYESLDLRGESKDTQRGGQELCESGCLGTTE